MLEHHLGVSVGQLQQVQVATPVAFSVEALGEREGKPAAARGDHGVTHPPSLGHARQNPLGPGLRLDEDELSTTDEHQAGGGRDDARELGADLPHESGPAQRQQDHENC